MNKLIFSGGMPRSGSTILMNILQQNPKIFTTGTCALTDLIADNILIKSRYREVYQAMSIEQVDKAMYGLVHGATKGWFEALTDKPVVISKNRNWSSIFHLYPKSKYIVTIRDLRDIVESFERVNERSLAIHSYSPGNGVLLPAMHTLEKYQHYFFTTNAFSMSLNAEIPRMIEWAQKESNRVLFVRYEDFVENPKGILNSLYDFIEEVPFNHDLNNIPQSELFEHDNAYFCERVEHTTQSKFMYNHMPERKLAKSFHDKVLYENEWYYNQFYSDKINLRKQAFDFNQTM